MKDIFLIRHGESESNKDIKVLLRKRDESVNLTFRGMMQCTEAGAFLKEYLLANNLIENNFLSYYSPYKRATQSHDLIMQELEGIKLSESQLVEEIVEQQFGFDSVNTENGLHKLKEEYYNSIEKDGYFFAKTSRGESPGCVIDRVKPFIEESILNADDTSIIIVAHATSIRAISHYLLNAKVEDFEQTPANSAIKHLRVSRGLCEDKGWIYTP
ncbi:MAG: histidine phosphatase family protein [Alphaproteobacteria bacterium]|jgi:broad specificity phosphatase PhoE|nr:histidine phosphatase family protein [Alphaproteobacteria bacterium]MCV6599071.1 histidine phosphatase family protein [Alphaproteobacteria bacterium]